MVENAFESIQGRGITAVAISGEPYQGGRMPVRLQPGLGYSQANEKLFPGPLWYSLKMAARQALGGEPDVWHFHNPALGKNSAMAEVVGKMAAESPVLLQFHDFAEDGRPANYAMLRDRMENIGKLYPQGAQVHYATCNARDHGFLCDSGFNRGNVHLLPNPVSVPSGDTAAGRNVTGGGAAGRSDGSAFAGTWAGQSAGGGVSSLDAHWEGSAAEGGRLSEALGSGHFLAEYDRGRLPGVDALREGQPLYLYPTRAIRRKNLGEFLLWAVLAAGQGQDALFVTTLAPENPAAKPVYERWLAFARGLGLPVAFAIGQGRGAPAFPALMRRAQAVVSTSVAEGFGLAFLEPWLFGRQVLGRNLPEITADFSAQGVDLSGLYDRLWVPESLFDKEALRAKIATGLVRTYEAYHRTPPADAVEVCLQAASDGAGRIDFGCLDESLQEQVIATLAASAALCREICPPQLDAAEQASHSGPASGSPEEQSRIAANAQAVEHHFGLEQYGNRLAALYREVADSHRSPLEYADPARVLDKFLTPARFSLLRTPLPTR